MSNNSKLVILFDSTSDFDDLDETISNSKSKIISFDYNTHKILSDKKINHDTSTKFIIITHNPITMANMDRLYGVTMAETGISKLISVKLQEAQKLREVS